MAVSVVCTFDSCRKECPQLPPPPPEEPRALHYFYVQNELDRDMQFGMDSWAPNNPTLPEKFTINCFTRVLLPSKEKTLVRVLQGKPGAEPLNRFYYSSVIAGGFSSYLKYPNNDVGKSDDLDKYDYWEYKCTDEWTAEYTLYLTEDFINRVF